MRSSLDRSNSRYVQGGTATSTANGHLGYWDRRQFSRDQSDREILITAEYHRKPWLVAYDFFKDPTLMWFVLQYNNILDIDTEFVNGVKITLPTHQRLRVGLLSRGQ